MRLFFKSSWFFANSRKSAISISLKQCPYFAINFVMDAAKYPEWPDNKALHCCSADSTISGVNDSGRSIAWNIQLVNRQSGLVPPRYALRLTVALPVADVAPVECSQGFHFWIAADCAARCSGVQCLAAISAPWAITLFGAFVRARTARHSRSQCPAKTRWLWI